MINFAPLEYFMDHMLRGRSPGSAVEVYLKGERVYQHTCGYADWENKILLTGNELYNIYSCSKIATVTAAMQLVEQGKCGLDDPLYAYIPEYKEMYIQKEEELVKANNPITLRHLFTMTAGLTYNMNTDAFRKARETTDGRMDTVETIRCLASDPISFEPGTQWQYSLCHDVLAAVVEVVSGMKFRDYMKKFLFDPLEMGETVYHQTPETLSRMAEQYNFVPYEASASASVIEQQSGSGVGDGWFENVGKGNRLVPGPEYDSGGAGIITSVSDYTKLMAALAGYGKGANGEQILRKETVELMRQNAISPEQLEVFQKMGQMKGCGYGLGVRTHLSQEQSGVISSLGEFGWGGAAGATAVIDPEIELAVFYAQHILNPREEYYQPRIRDIVYRCL